MKSIMDKTEFVINFIDDILVLIETEMQEQDIDNLDISKYTGKTLEEVNDMFSSNGANFSLSTLGEIVHLLGLNLELRFV
jgi:hypothetical protein